MGVSTTGGARLYIGPVVNLKTLAALSVPDAKTYFAGLSYTEVENIESFGDLGDVSEAASFAAVKDRRVSKFKTVRDAGSMAIVVGRDGLDDGQNALIAAEKTDFNYAFKVVLDDAPDDAHTSSTQYFAGMVMSRANNIGAGSDITKTTFNISVNTQVYEILTAASSAPTNVTRPSIVGTSLAQAATLTADEGTWLGDPTSYTYQWQADTSGNGTFANISGATARTHVIAAGQAGDAVRVQVTAVNGAGSSSAANSLSVGLCGS